MWLVVGLGNPGEKYMNTRHNVGFQCVNHLANRYQMEFRNGRANASLAEGHIANQRVIVAKPLTYMNLSGNAVSALCSWYKISFSERLVVIYDDMDLDFGRVRIRQQGGPGTHNGMKSIVAQLGSKLFPRLRVGIGIPPRTWDAADYVLGRFHREEEHMLPDLYDRVADIVTCIVQEGLVVAMNRYNSSEGKKNDVR